MQAPAAVLNLGGVANITFWTGADDIVAFDTGPANGPINEWIEQHGRGRFDQDGASAAAGRVDEQLVRTLLARPYFSQPLPKSLDRFDFSAALVGGMGVEDGAATLTAFCAAAVSRGLDVLPSRPREIIVCGGGRKNPVLMEELARRTKVAVVDCDALGWHGDFVEAECFAYLAARVLKGMPISLPLTTGVSAPTRGGRLCHP
jgi:anhydro-N-acetylmuramic acid kinase